MQGIEQLRDISQRVLALSAADETEVVLHVYDEQLTRFANNEVHQNVAETNFDVRVRVAIGQRIGVAQGNATNEQALEQVVEHAIQLAHAQPENEGWPGLPEPVEPEHVEGFMPSTAGMTPRRRAEAVERVTRQAHEAGCTASGALSTTARELVVANTNDLFIYYPLTEARFVTVVMSDSGSGYAEGAHVDVNGLDLGELGEEAVDSAVRSREPVEIEPGEWDVVLDHYAVGDMMRFLGVLGLHGAAYVEQRSFASGRMNEKVTGENITLVDNGLDPATLPLPFDLEGVPRRALPLIENGAVRNVVWDRYWAKRGGTESTGHALPAPNTTGPMPIHLQLAAGDSSREELIKGVKKGLLVTRFHYTRPVHPLKTIVTGLTRDGTFLIEDGEIVAPVKNLRFTESYLDAFSRVDGITADRRLITTNLGFKLASALAPSVRLRGFTFTGKTGF